MRKAALSSPVSHLAGTECKGGRRSTAVVSWTRLFFLWLYLEGSRWMSIAAPPYAGMWSSCREEPDSDIAKKYGDRRQRRAQMRKALRRNAWVTSSRTGTLLANMFREHRSA